MGDVVTMSILILLLIFMLMMMLGMQMQITRVTRELGKIDSDIRSLAERLRQGVGKP